MCSVKAFRRATPYTPCKYLTETDINPEITVRIRNRGSVVRRRFVVDDETTIRKKVYISTSTDMSITTIKPSSRPSVKESVDRKDSINLSGVVRVVDSSTRLNIPYQLSVALRVSPVLLLFLLGSNEKPPLSLSFYVLHFKR